MSSDSSIDEGVIKYDASDFIQEPLTRSTLLNELNDIRSRLFKMNLIGEYPIEKVGFGNLSIRSKYSDLPNKNSFIISGTQTGHLPLLDSQHYTHVVDYDVIQNSVSVRGPVQASSESLTHAAIYECHPEIQCVIHVHSAKIWHGMLENQMPHTPSAVPYGTPQMAEAVKSVINDKVSGVLAMAGHEDGVITYGTTIQEALDLCQKLYQKFV